MTSDFWTQQKRRIEDFGKDADFQNLSQVWLRESMRRQYVYNFSWLGRPIIQYPGDMVSVQELIWAVRPDLIIETGIAHGGSLILSASMLAMLDMCDAIETGATIDPRVSGRKVLGIDIDIRKHNRDAIEAHPMASRIEMIEGSSIAPGIVERVAGIAGKFRNVMVFLDSMHTHAHVMAELEAYAPLTSVNSYCVVFDTFVEDMPAGFFDDRPWDVGNNPKTAVTQWIKSNPSFEIDRSIQHKLMITVAPDGFLKRIR